ncbi:binding-protein-dependent transport systems inner membrane component [Catenulispora acidiphila DSM 44928]|uniref:Binding-protein-dependent transport systems inner membrane component n=1 Tax=Catenulispora acidiphila (strain DSM 44928 / JCM 14897 / NBRC 102108 / NRRL B-24433 / ID139908) TaxID=479433 RepID=C7QJF1_CATAD|nr:carbohydrate ABC transporter permease [Catenulispora acidiphila]ACU71174.1 binding-protein-dependent transport systems inner membrane component [Catenulispora acidiphila DSM 44928]
MTATTAEDSREREDKAGRAARRPGSAVRNPNRKGRSPIFDAPTPHGLVLRYTALVVVLVISIGPMLWELSTSLKSKAEDVYTQNIQLLPHHPTLGNYGEVQNTIPVWHFALNSLTVAVINVTGNVIGATLAGYVLARLKFKGRKLLLAVFVSTLILPAEVTVISKFQMITSMGLGDSILGVCLPDMIAMVNVLLMRNAFLALPKEVEEAAIIDGANAVQRLRHVGLPAVKGVLSVISIFAFIGAWDDFLWPLLVLQSPNKLTLTVGLSYLNGQWSHDPRTIAAGTMMALLPILALFLLLQRYFFRGVAEGAIKG